MDETGKGHLFVVGGAEDKQRGRLILSRFVETAGGRDARILINATASSMPEALLGDYEEAFRAVGVSKLHLCHQRQRADAQDPALIAAVNDATGVYFTGGDQLKSTLR